MVPTVLSLNIFAAAAASNAQWMLGYVGPWRIHPMGPSNPGNEGCISRPHSKDPSKWDSSWRAAVTYAVFKCVLRRMQPLSWDTASVCVRVWAWPGSSCSVHFICSTCSAYTPAVDPLITLQYLNPGLLSTYCRFVNCPCLTAFSVLFSAARPPARLSACLSASQPACPPTCPVCLAIAHYSFMKSSDCPKCVLTRVSCTWVL